MRRVHIPAVILAVAAIAALYGWAVVASTPTHPGSIGLNLNALGTDWMPTGSMNLLRELRCADQFNTT